MMLVLCTAAALAGVWLVASKLHRFAYWIGRKTDAQIAALATNGWQVDRLTVAPDVTLVGLVRPPKVATGRWILFVPGNSQSVLEGFRAVLDELRGPADVGMAFWAFRGFDLSGGSPNPAVLATDLMAQWRHLQSLGATPERTEIWGYSLGSILAVQLAAAVAETGAQPRRLVLLATGPQIRIMRHGWFGRFLPADVYDLTAALPLVNCATVIAHGTADDALPLEGAKGVARVLGARATLHELAGKGHVDLWGEVRRVAFVLD